MKLEVLRYSSNTDSTLGLLFDATYGREFLCYTLEDEKRMVKVPGETRIPSGTYKLGLRTEGGFHTKYAKRTDLKDIHKGMIHVLDVPNFKWILWHIGNTDEDTAGCLLLGNETRQNITQSGTISFSTSAYRRVYPRIADAILNGEDCEVTYVDYDFRIEPFI